MLTVEENYWNFKFLKWCISLHIFPLHLDPITNRLSIPGKWRIRIWFLRFGMLMLQYIYLTTRLVQSVLDMRFFYMNHFVVHYLLVSGYGMMITWMYFCFILYLPDFVIIFNQLFIPLSISKIGDLEFGSSPGSGVPLPIMIPMPIDGDTRINVINSAHSAKAKEKDGDGRIDVINSAHSANGKETGTKKARSLFSLKSGLTQHEALTVGISWLVFGEFVAITGVNCIGSKRIQLLYFSVPEEYKNVYVLIALYVVEAITLTLIMAGNFLIQWVELAFMEKCTSDFQILEDMLKELEDAATSHSHFIRSQTVDRIVKGLEEINVLIVLFNRCFPYVIFSFKIFCLSICIFFPFFTIRYNTEHRLLAMFTLYMAQNCFNVYTTMYGQAFKIPEQLENLKIKIQMASKEFSGTERKKVEKVLRKIPDNLGMKVGNFHMLDRTSTPEFVNFVVDQLVGLLVTFP